MANVNERNSLASKPAPAQAASAEVGTELLCANFEGGASSPIVGKVIGKDDRWVRLRIEELGREWLVRPDRIDLAKGTWEHVDADYPRLGEEPAFDAEFRPALKTKDDPKKAAAIKDAAAKLGALLPESLRKQVEEFAAGATDKLIGGPAGSVLARWTGKGTLDGPFVDRKTKAVKRGAATGAEGWFPKSSVQKYEKHFELL
jgi:hypothetical protein